MKPPSTLSPLPLVAATALLASGELLAQDDTLIIEEESEILLIEDEPSSDTSTFDATSFDTMTLDIDEGDQPELEIGESADDDHQLTFSEDTIDPELTDAQEDAPLVQVDQLWVEANHFGDSNSEADSQAYIHGSASFNWKQDHWEIKAEARVDGYSQNGEQDFNNTDLDYGEAYVRYRGENSAITAGMQKIVWGRIDEFPPSDRLSTQDLRRVALDDLEDRRLASAAVRYEHFFENSKVDIVAYPSFREAQLPDHESVWFPINRKSGDILGLETNALLESIVRAAPIRENAPDSEGGIGARFTSLGGSKDYAITIQRGRASVPYFAFNPDTNTIEGRYPRNWMVGGDIAIEALGGTLKFEGNWLSDTPVTRKDGRYTTTESISWGAALELFPGDGDGRLNLQLTGQNLLDAPDTIDRHEIYSFNGTYETPFADNNWRAKVRFNIGLDEKDIYINPEIAYTGFEAQEIYVELHYFDGDEGTAGGFYSDNSIAALGWRADL